MASLGLAVAAQAAQDAAERAEDNADKSQHDEEQPLVVVQADGFVPAGALGRILVEQVAVEVALRTVDLACHVR